MAQMRELIGNSLGTITQYQDRIAATSAKAGVVVQATETAESTNGWPAPMPKMMPIR